jgi:hypothetical protein
MHHAVTAAAVMQSARQAQRVAGRRIGIRFILVPNRGRLWNNGPVS